MRSIRRAAIAGATAATLILGAATATAAEDNAQTQTQKASSTEKLNSSGNNSDDKNTTEKKDKASSGSSKGGKTEEDSEASSKVKRTSTEIGAKLDANQPANGARLFGSTDDFKKEPKWAQYMAIATYVGVIGSLLGLVVFPVYNFLVANHMLPGMPK